MDKSSFLGRLKEIWRAVTAIGTVTAREVSPEDNDRPLVLPRTRGRFSGRPQPPVIQADRVPSRNPLAVNVATPIVVMRRVFETTKLFQISLDFGCP